MSTVVYYLMRTEQWGSGGVTHGTRYDEYQEIKEICLSRNEYWKDEVLSWPVRIEQEEACAVPGCDSPASDHWATAPLPSISPPDHKFKPATRTTGTRHLRRAVGADISLPVPKHFDRCGSCKHKPGVQRVRGKQRPCGCECHLEGALVESVPGLEVVE